MPAWAGKWKGGRYYLDAQGRKVFFIERRVAGQVRSVKLKTHDEDLAVGELARFLDDPEAFARRAEPASARDRPVYMTRERIQLYLTSIAGTVAGHREARAHYLAAWSTKKLDLRSVGRKELRAALASFETAHVARANALNAFCNFLVREEDLPSWNPLVNTHEQPETRAKRVAYSVEQLKEAFAGLTAQYMRDVLLVRAATGLHHTEIEQIQGAPLFTGPLPDTGTGVRDLGEGHAIRGVLQIRHKSRHRHRQSLTGPVLDAVLRLREYVPTTSAVWLALGAVGVIPSNLRHTFVTLAGEIGELVTFSGKGVARSSVAQIVGHRQGSTMTADHYEKVQVPPMVLLPLGFP